MAFENDEDVAIELELRDYLSANAKVAAREIDEMADNTRQLNRQLLLLDRRSTRAAIGIGKLTAAVKAYNAVAGNSVNNLNLLNKQVETYTGRNNTLTKSLNRVDAAGRRSNRTMLFTLRHLKSIIRFAPLAASALGLVAVAMGAIGLAAAGGVAVQGLIQVAGALASLISLSALLPTAIGGIIATVLTLVVAFNGVGEAIGAAFANDPAKLNEALKKLSPSARAVVKEFLPFVKQLKQLQQLTQEALFKPLVKALGPALKALLPVLTKGMTGLAGTFGLLIEKVLEFLRSSRGLEIINEFFIGAQHLIEAFIGSFDELGRGFHALIMAAGPAWDRFVSALETGLVKFGRWMADIAEDGRLEKWLDSAFNTAAALADILMLVGSILGELVSAAGGSSGIMGVIVDFLEQVNDWIESVEGQQVIQSFFGAMREILEELSPLLLIFADAIGSVFGPTLREIVLGLAPGVETFLIALRDALKLMIPYWGVLAQAVSDALIALAPLLPVLGELLGTVGLGLAQLLQALAGYLGPLIQAVSEPLAAMIRAFNEASMDRMGILTDLATQFADALADLAPMLTEVATIFLQEFNKYLAQTAPIMAQMTPMLLELAFLLGQAIVQALQQMMPYMPDLIDAFFQFMLTLAQVAPVLLPQLIYFLEKILPQIIPLTPTILQVATALLRFGTQALNTTIMVLGWFDKMRRDFEEWKSKIKAIFDTIEEIFLGPFRRAKDAILGIFDEIRRNARNLIPALNFKLPDLNPFRAFGGPVEAGVTYTVGEIGPELFVPNVGSPQMIGLHGMEERSFPTSGMVIPSYMLDAFSKVEEGVARQLASMERQDVVSRAEVVELVAAGVKAATTSGDTYHVNVHFHGQVSSEVDIERAVRKAIEKIERDKRERS